MVETGLSKTQVLERFLHIESSLDLFSFREGDMPVWELLRYPLHRDLLVMLGIETSTLRPPQRDLRSRLRRAVTLLASFTTRNPLHAEKEGVLIFGHPRRVNVDGLYADIYSNPFLSFAPSRYRFSILERPSETGLHSNPTPLPAPLYLDLLYWQMGRQSRQANVQLSSSCQAWCEQLDDAFREAFEIDAGIKQRVHNAVVRWTVEIPLFANLLRRLRPRALLLVVSAENETIIEAAKRLGIPTAELQHGSPAPGKLNYDFPPGVTKRTFPDYFLSFGPFWQKSVNLPLPDDRVLNIGFPYLATRQAKFSAVERGDQLLVLDQPPIRKELVPFVVDLAKQTDVKIVFKLHPMSFDNKDQQQLLEAGVTIAGTDSDLYELFASSRWQLGVYSTAIYEGLAFDCRTFILDAPGAEYMKSLIDAGVAELVTSPADLALDSSDISSAGEELFCPVTVGNIERALEKITSG